MRNMVLEAGILAIDELENNRHTMILVPDLSWSPAMYDLGAPPYGIFIRFSDRHTGLRTVLVNTLITIDECEEEGVLLAKELLRTALEPRMISIHRDRDNTITTGRDIWK